MSEFSSRSRKVPARGTNRPSAEQSPRDFAETVAHPTGIPPLICEGLDIWLGEAARELRNLGFDYDEIEPRIVGLVKAILDGKIIGLRRGDVVAVLAADREV